MNRRRERQTGLVDFVLTWRWPLVAIMTLTTVVVELEEHQVSLTSVNMPFVREVVLFGLFFPGMVGIMLSLMWRAQRQSELMQGVAKDERQRIARDLHDSLAQELGFLRLRLEQLTSDPNLKDAAMRQQLEQLTSVASLAYQHVRGGLEQLQSLVPRDLATAILEHARTLEERANFTVSWRAEGEPVAVAQEKRRQVLMILAEALANVERHAGASRVDMVLSWEAESMIISIADNGHGFDTGSVDPHGMGISVMRQRAQEIGGNFAVTSRFGQGTKITLMVPIERPASDDEDAVRSMQKSSFKSGV